ncbi:MAG: transporter [Bacteroidetes bacterium]|jgi:outer membrane protein|nr:transporter [Bacteroidota bacterium]MDF2452687.1 transporter [Bacteroidota bacterium]
MKTILTIFLFVGVLNIASSQTGTWDLQQCVDYAQKNNISIKQAEIAAKINQNNATQSKAAILPTVNAGAQHTYNFGRTIDRYTNTFANSQVLSQNFYVSSNVILWSGLAQYNNIKANQYQYLSSAENYLQQRNDLALNVATAYINVIFSDEILQIARAQYKITEEQLDRTQKLADAGTLAKSAVYDLKAQLANEDVNVISSDNNYQIALLSLKQLLNLDSVSNFAITRPNVDILNNELASLSVQTVYESALKNQHSVRSAEYNVMAAEKSLDVAKGRVSPTLSATGSLGTGTSELDKNIDAVNFIGSEQTPYYIADDPNNPTLIYPVYQPKTEIITSKKPFADQFKDNVNKSVGFTLSIPIFNGLQTVTGVKNAKLSALNAKYSQDLLQQNLYKTIAQAYANARAALNKYNASKSAVEASEQSFFYAEQKLNVGAISTFDYNNAKVRSQNALGNMVQAKYDYVFKLKVLDYYQGKELKF